MTTTWQLGAGADGPRHADACGVLLVDDHDAFRRVARAVVEATEQFEVVGEASSGEGSIELAARLAPDLIVMDVRMPGIGGVEAAERVRALLPDARHRPDLGRRRRGDQRPSERPRRGRDDAQARALAERADRDLATPPPVRQGPGQTARSER